MAAVDAAFESSEPSADPHIIRYREDTTLQTPPEPKPRASPRSRQTLQWPFQSMSLEHNTLSPMPSPPPPAAAAQSPVAPMQMRPATWQPRSRIPKNNNNTFSELEDDDQLNERTSRRLSLIPDYIINYLRGDTPETIARRLREQEDAAAAAATMPTASASADKADTDEARLRGGGIYASSIDHDHDGKRRAAKHGHGPFSGRGWRAGMALHALAAAVVLVAGIACLVLALTVASSTPVDVSGLAVVFSCAATTTTTTITTSKDSPCYAAYQVTWALRAVLAACTVAILAGAQYTFHILCSPTRAELDAAHAGRQWLDIGVPSLRSCFFLLRHRGGGRARVRAVVALTAVSVALATSVLYGSLVGLTVGVPSMDPLSANATDRTTTTYSVTLNISLLAAAVALNAITLLCICFTLVLQGGGGGVHRSSTPLITLGDAVASFLCAPDHTTRGACLLSKQQVVKDGLWDRMATPSPKAVSTDAFDSTDSLRDGSAQSAGRSSQPENTTQPMVLASTTTTNYYWFRSVPGVQWLVGALVWCTLAALAVAALVLSLVRGDAVDVGSRFGYFPLQHALLSSSNDSPLALSTGFALLASLPQLGLAVLSVLTNAHLTCYFLSHESSRYYTSATATEISGRRGLRVSCRPRGHQTTSLYLTLPPVWHGLLLVLFAGLFFATSQSLVAVSVGHGPQHMLIGCSATGLIVLLGLLLVLALLVLGLGMRRTTTKQNPLTLPGGSCSAVISARCHPSSDELEKEKAGPLPLWLRPLAWGPVPGYRHGSGDDAAMDTQVGHCTFSSGPLLPLDTTLSYA